MMYILSIYSIYCKHGTYTVTATPYPMTDISQSSWIWYSKYASLLAALVDKHKNVPNGCSNRSSSGVFKSDRGVRCGAMWY